MAGRLYRAGVPIVAGTDTPAPWVLPGAGLIRELELLVECGLTPMDAIRSATGRAAEVMRKDAETGTIRPGRRADLLLLDSDPLMDIRALRRPRSVYLNGRAVNLANLRRAFQGAQPIPLKPG